MNKLILTTMLVISMAACTPSEEPSPESTYADAASVFVLDTAWKAMTPCFDMLDNKNSSDIAVVTYCQKALLQYERIGGNQIGTIKDSLIKTVDKERVQILLDRHPEVNDRINAIIERNIGNQYFINVINMQQFAESTIDQSVRVREADHVTNPQRKEYDVSQSIDDGTSPKAGSIGTTLEGPGSSGCQTISRREYQGCE